MIKPVTESTVRKEVVVDAPIERAFRVFTEQFDKIKPHEHTLLPVAIAETVFETRVGGHIYDRGVDGTICRWARVLTFDPPHRVVFTWDISPQWALETNPDKASEVEVRFAPDSANRTRVTLEHRNIDRHGDGWQDEYQAVDGPNGWPLYLDRFAQQLKR